MDVTAINPAAILLLVLAVAIGLVSRPGRRWASLILAASVTCGWAYWLAAYSIGYWPMRCFILDGPGECVLSFMEKWGGEYMLRFTAFSFAVLFSASCICFVFRSIARRKSD